MVKKLTLVADENIPLLDEIFADSAEIIRLPGRQMQAAALKSADALLVRSITQVNEQLLQASSVQFVGSCTIGVDHIDQTYLASKGVGFANAPGCNAAAVVDYVMAALLALQPELAHWQAKVVGIIGYGEVGSRLHQRLSDCGIQTRIFDPFKAFAKNSLEDVLACDVISLHVPFTQQGAHKTAYLLNQSRLQQLKTGCVLINTSRGKVVDNHALLNCLQAGEIQAVLDVYEDEPKPSVALLQQLDIATPHIAGYSMHGKMRGTLQVVEQMKTYFDLPLTIPDVLADYQARIEVTSRDSAAQVMLKSYDIRQDSAAFIAHYKKAITADEQALCFDAYRKNYPNRYELAYSHVLGASEQQALTLSAVGFAVGRAKR